MFSGLWVTDRITQLSKVIPAPIYLSLVVTTAEVHCCCYTVIHREPDDDRKGWNRSRSLSAWRKHTHTFKWRRRVFNTFLESWISPKHVSYSFPKVFVVVHYREKQEMMNVHQQLSQWAAHARFCNSASLNGKRQHMFRQRLLYLTDNYNGRFLFLPPHLAKVHLLVLFLLDGGDSCCSCGGCRGSSSSDGGCGGLSEVGWTSGACGVRWVTRNRQREKQIMFRWVLGNMKESLVLISLKPMIYDELEQFVESDSNTRTEKLRTQCCCLQWTEQRRLEFRLITLDLSRRNTPKRLDLHML